jgi:phage/plasmid-like protein (TIGR03299 family)
LSFTSFGTIFDNAEISVNEAFEQANLNYNVVAQPLVRVPQNVLDALVQGTPTMWTPTKNDIITSHKATLRDDVNHTLGVVGKDYGIVQNTKAFEFLDFIEECSGHAPKIVSAGALGYGERMFITAQLGDDAYLNPNDAVKNYVVFTNSHDGTGAVMCFFTPIRVVCQNTLNMAIHSCPNKVIFKHTKHVGTRLDWEIAANREKAKEVFSKSVKFSEEFLDKMMMLKEQRIDTEFMNNFTAEMYLNSAQMKLLKQANGEMDKVDEISTRARNQINALRDAIANGVGQNENRSTKLWLLNGVTTFLHNDRNYKSVEDEFKSMLEGDAFKKTQRAYDLLTKAA